MKNWIKIVTCFVVLLLMLPLFGATANANEALTESDIASEESTWKFRRSWGGEGDRLFSSPYLAVSREGKIYLSQQNHARIVVIDTKDDSFFVFGERGIEIGQILSPTAIAISPDDSVYVIDKNNRRVQSFTPEGQFIQAFGKPGLGEGEFDSPKDIVIDQYGYVYVAERSRIQVFTPNGEFVRQWGEFGEADGQFKYIGGLVVDAEQNVYVIDSLLPSRVQKFDKYGVFLGKWDADPLNPNPMTEYIFDIAIDRDGSILIVGHRHDILKFSPDGEFMGKVSEKPFDHLRNLVVDHEGYFFSSDEYQANVRKYSRTGEELVSWGSHPKAPGNFSDPRSVVITPDSKVIVAERDNDRIQVFNIEGTFLKAVDVVRQPRGLTLDKSGNLFLLREFRFIEAYTPDFELFKSFELDDSANDLAIDTENNIFISRSYSITKMSPDGVVLTKWDYPEDSWVYAIEVLNNELYVSIRYLGIHVYDLNGMFIRRFGEDLLREPAGMDMDEEGYFYVTESEWYPSSVVVFDPNGNFVEKIGKLGSGPNNFQVPVDVAVKNGYLVVVDSRNHRVQTFTKGFPAQDGHSGLVQNGDFERNLSEWSRVGELPIELGNYPSHGSNSLLLGKADAHQQEQGKSKATAYSNFYVNPEWARPVLTFDYNMFVNDIKDYSDFYVEIQDGVGLSHLATVVHDGFNPCIPGVAPSAGRNLGWRSVKLDLSQYKGQHIRLVFSNRNRWDNAWGIWIHVDNVRVLDYGYAPPIQGPYHINLPLISTFHCDPLGKGEFPIRELPGFD